MVCEAIPALGVPSEIASRWNRAHAPFAELGRDLVRRENSADHSDRSD